MLVVVGCDSAPPVDPPAEVPAPAPSVRLDAGQYDVTVDAAGALMEGAWGDTSTATDVSTFFDSGLWVSGRRDGGLAASLTFAGSNWAPLPANGQAGGVYLLSPASGLPAGVDRLRGDQMAWSQLVGQPNDRSPVLAQPVEGLRVDQAAFVYTRPEASDLLFVRYVLTNTGATPLTDAYAGIYADTDLQYQGTTSAPGASLYDNLTGYDAARGLTYTYQQASRDNAAVSPALATGYAFLSTPGDAPLMSHRVVRRNNIDPDFGETGFSRPEQVDWALRGRSNTNVAMTDPTTGATTLFAFTGDPVTRSGWLDGFVDPQTGVRRGSDTRSLLSAGPFRLAPGESTALTVVYVTVEGVSFPSALGALGERVDAVRSQPALWQ